MTAPLQLGAAEHQQNHDQQGKGPNPSSKGKPYTLKKCVVAGEELGSMGAPYVHTHKDREIKFCCKGCLKNFNKNPDKYIKEIETAEKKGAK